MITQSNRAGGDELNTGGNGLQECTQLLKAHFEASDMDIAAIEAMVQSALALMKQERDGAANGENASESGSDSGSRSRSGSSSSGSS